MINEAAAERAQAWVQEAATAGATTVTGGDRDRALLTPTVLANVPGDARVNRDEVFAPVLTVTAVDSEQEAFDAVNDSAFGLQAGVFTHDLAKASAHTASSRWEASSSVTSLPTGPSRCLTAGPSSPAWAGRESGSPWTT